MFEKDAVVEKWLKKEGETFNGSENVCEVTLKPSDLMIGVNANNPGILAKILIPEGKISSENDPIALLVKDREQYLAYIDDERVESKQEEILIETKDVLEQEKRRPDVKILLRELKHLINEGAIPEDSGKNLLQSMI